MDGRTWSTDQPLFVWGCRGTSPPMGGPLAGGVVGLLMASPPVQSLVDSMINARCCVCWTVFASSFRPQCALATAALLALTPRHRGAAPRPCPVATPARPRLARFRCWNLMGVPHARYPSRCHAARLDRVHVTWFHPHQLPRCAVSTVGPLRGDGDTGPPAKEWRQKKMTCASLTSPV